MIATDPDLAGQGASRSLQHALAEVGARSVDRLEFPTDVNDFARQLGGRFEEQFRCSTPAVSPRPNDPHHHASEHASPHSDEKSLVIAAEVVDGLSAPQPSEGTNLDFKLPLDESDSVRHDLAIDRLGGRLRSGIGGVQP